MLPLYLFLEPPPTSTGFVIQQFARWALWPGPGVTPDVPWACGSQPLNLLHRTGSLSQGNGLRIIFVHAQMPSCTPAVLSQPVPG